VRRENARDELVITVEGTGANALAERMKSRYGLTATVMVVESGTLPRSEGKARRVFDHRKDKPA
jgi:phenylacetate-CoA ligase